jgi:putative intracellular protease/amidase
MPVGGQRGLAKANCMPCSALCKSWDVVIVSGLGLSHALDPVTALTTSKGHTFVHALQEQNARGALLAISCTASFAMAEAGLLDGRLATTCWWLAAEFRYRYPTVNLREGALTTEDSKLLCAGGTLAHVALWSDAGSSQSEPGSEQHSVLIALKRPYPSRLDSWLPRC